ncbi:MAG: 50S ribosomal protein L7/L12 [Bacilli bacterium]|jgi:large subunit ribosomal protein L7/L12|nr:50S ribosomal protein L7/L12 [Bacilli bacterium]MCX4254180.1 50S ribosomal protein L7/L12 [Bacilli bacterium]
MAKLTKEDFISALKEMTILEVKELVDAMKEEFGVDPSAVAVAAAPAAGAEDAGSATKTVVLKNAGGNKIAVIKIIKEITGLGLVEAKAIADNGGNLKENIPADEAEALKTQLTEAGAEVELV